MFTRLPSWASVVTQTEFVSLSGDCIVSNIDHHCRTLVVAFQSKGPLIVDLAQVEAVDVTLVQLIVSASKTAARDNRAFYLTSVPIGIQAAFLSAGVALNLESGQISL